MATETLLSAGPLLISANPRAVCEVLDRGPNWLFVRAPRGRLLGRNQQLISLSGELWRLADRHFTYRLVLHLDVVEGIDAAAAAELVRLQRMLESYQGSLRLCGLKADCGRQTLLDLHCDSLHNYATQKAAVVGYPCQDQPTRFEAAEPDRRQGRRQQAGWPVQRHRVLPR